MYQKSRLVRNLFTEHNHKFVFAANFVGDVLAPLFYAWFASVALSEKFDVRHSNSDEKSSFRLRRLGSFLY